jgi:hypothetical protein
MGASAITRDDTARTPHLDQVETLDVELCSATGPSSSASDVGERKIVALDRYRSRARAMAASSDVRSMPTIAAIRRPRRS